MDLKHKKTLKSEQGLTLDALKGKQSVRATFRLPKQVIDLLSVVAAQLGIKQKSLFDQLVEDISVLGQLAEEAHNYFPREQERRQKTFVISRNSLVSLDFIAQKEQVPRDVLVEISIKRLLPVIDNELKRHETRKILLKEMKDYLVRGKKLLEKAGDLLGENDNVYSMIEHQINLCERNVATLNSLVERGKAMENW